MKNYRIFVEKYPEFQVEADSLRRELNDNLALSLESLRLINVYDLFGFDEELVEKCRYSVFGEVVTDQVTDTLELEGKSYLAIEFLPGQFDQRAASAVDCVRLIDPKADVRIRSSKIMIFSPALSQEQMEQVKHYCINSVESREKNLKLLGESEDAEVRPVPIIDGLRELKDSELATFCKEYGFARNSDDLREVVNYFSE